MKRLFADACLFSFGYSAYSLIELAWRKYTHFTMGIAGGLCFLALYRLFGRFKNLAVYKKCLLGSAVITSIEYIFGVILNLRLKLKIWDYSDMPLNLSGQVCLLYSLFWAILSLPICKLVPIISKIENKMQKRAA